MPNFEVPWDGLRPPLIHALDALLITIAHSQTISGQVCFYFKRV